MLSKFWHQESAPIVCSKFTYIWKMRRIVIIQLHKKAFYTLGIYKSYFLSSSLETGYEVQFNHFLTLSVSLHNNFRSIRVFLYIICLVFHIKGSSRFHMLVSADRHFRYWENKFSTINPKKPFEKVLNFNYLLDNW